MYFETAWTILAFVTSPLAQPLPKRSACIPFATVQDDSACTVPEKYAKLLNWMREQGSEIHESIVIRPSELGGGYGAFVSQAVSENELLFTVPRQACVTVSNALTDEVCGSAFQKIIDKAGPGGNTVVLAGFLARERIRQLDDQASRGNFEPYLDLLPWERGQNDQEHILFWSDEDIERLLKGSMCYNEAKELRSEVALATQILGPILSRSIRDLRGENIQEGFRWPWETNSEEPQAPIEGVTMAVTGAFVTQLTRAFEDGDADGEKLVPLLDMLQHSEEPNISHGMRVSDGTVEVRSRRALQPGEELFNLYRSELEESMPYHRFFTRFGFVPGIQDEPVEDLLQDKSSIFFAQTAEV